jgi:homoserine O-succinyltransferase/O-acetyltransferase
MMAELFGAPLQSLVAHDQRDHPIVIGLVNNMPDAALQTTERQFGDLLSAASRDIAVRLRFFSFPEVARGDAGRLHISQHYQDISELWGSQIDALIVTGTEPRTPDLADEPYWRTLTRLVEWAEENTIATVWSCLAAHAAVLHMDGIARRPFGAKLSGVFGCVKVSDHRLLAGAPSRWRVPHSRYNDLPEETLVKQGYEILSRSSAAGADIFVKQRTSLFLFLQGHPEYDAGALLREYRRDVRRFLVGEGLRYPEMPRGYFDEHSTVALNAFRRQALLDRDFGQLSRFPAADDTKLAHAWRRHAVRLYANLLSYVTEQRSRRCYATEHVSAERAAT